MPTGTVLFRTTIASAAKCGAKLSTTCQTNERSALPSAAGGVPTAMKINCASATASARLVVNRSRPAAALRETNSASPGS